jgi:alpha-glucan, water dikinase
MHVQHARCPSGCREMLYLDLALEGVVRGAAERGAGKAAGASAAPLVGPLLQNLALSIGDNEEVHGWICPQLSWKN